MSSHRQASRSLRIARPFVCLCLLACFDAVAYADSDITIPPEVLQAEEERIELISIQGDANRSEARKAAVADIASSTE